MFLSKNLKFLREQNGRQSQEALANELEITRSAVSSYEDGRAEPKLSVMNKMAEYFNLNLDQLLNVDLSLAGGNIGNARKGEPRKYASAQNLRVLTITLDDYNNENVELVANKNEAGYLKGFSNPDYLSDLPKYQLPFLSQGKTYRAFEISGDSMLPLMPNSIVIAEYVDNWTNLEDATVCIVVAKNDGIVLKKVYNKIEDTGTLLLKSTNITYRPYEVFAEDVLEVWKFSAYISKAIPEEHNTIQGLKDAFLRLEDELREVKKQQENKFGV